MQPEFWNQRYRSSDTVYGYGPNAFFRQFIDRHKPGTILLPAEGEGRNARYAASKGWTVDAFDFSEVAREKALQQAAAENLSIQYTLQDLSLYKAGKTYDAVGLMYVHLEPALRKSFHQEMIQSLKPGGLLVLEAFAKEQLGLDSGGPKDVNLLYDAPGLCADFHSLHMLDCRQQELVLAEGPFHTGPAHVLRLTGQRL